MPGAVHAVRLVAGLGLGIGSRLCRQRRRCQLALVDAEKIVAPLFRGRGEHPCAGKSAATDLADPIVVAVERGDSIRQRCLVMAT